MQFFVSVSFVWLICIWTPLLAIKADSVHPLLSLHLSVVPPSTSCPTSLLAMAQTDLFNLWSSTPPLFQKAQPSSSPPQEAKEASPGPSPTTPLDGQPHTFYHLCPPPHGIPDMPTTFSHLQHAVWGCMFHMAPHCTICYFLHHKHPIKVILTHLLVATLRNTMTMLLNLPTALATCLWTTLHTIAFPVRLTHPCASVTPAAVVGLSALSVPSHGVHPPTRSGVHMHPMPFSLPILSGKIFPWLCLYTAV